MGMTDTCNNECDKKRLKLCKWKTCSWKQKRVNSDNDANDENKDNEKYESNDNDENDYLKKWW